MEIKLLSCPLCLKPHFEGVDSLRTSLISVATSTLNCPVCSESLLGLDKLTIHLFTHINVTNNKEKNQEEIINEEIDKSIYNLANNCLNNKETKQQQQQQTLLQAIIEEEENKNDDCIIKCDICYFNFTDKTILEMHQKLLHQTPPDKNTGLYSYHCHLCSKKFKMRGSLMVHLRVAHYGFGHHNSSEISQQNNEENKTNNTTASSSSSSDANLLVLNSANGVQNNKDNKQWECEVCTKLFTTKYFLKKHKRLHTGEMPYYCIQCNKSFTFQQSYHKHMLYHSSEKPYVCNECGRAFKELSTLQNHSRIHSGERPFGCETCGKRFRQRVSYLVHQRIHTGVMPYKCTACEKSFRYKVSQRSHKCPINPPGSVIRVPELMEKISKQSSTATNVLPSNKEMNVKCILSVDYNTGNINFIPNKQNSDVKVVYLNNEENEQVLSLDRNDGEIMKISGSDECNNNNNNGNDDNNNNNEKDLKQNDGLMTNNNEMNLCVDTTFTIEQPDLFSMVLSPLLPEVESLCLSNSPIIDINLNKTSDNIKDSFQGINEESFKELFYGGVK